MHPTTTVPRSRLRAGLMALLGSLLLLSLALAAPAFAAKSPFDGGPIAADTSTYAANDQTAYAMRFSTTSGTNPLAANTTYYVKIRFTPDTAAGQPQSTNNRGFVWNGTTKQWVQESDSTWSDFPTVRTDASGAVLQSPWFYYKFGDTTKTGEYGLIVSLSPGTTGNTLNGTSWVDVKVFDPATAGGWVHDGVDNSAYADKRVDVVAHGASASAAPVALSFAEKNGVDDDSNGVVDDEHFGPVQNGGFDLAVPVDQALDVRMQKSVWPGVPAAAGFQLTTPDTDIALGAGDMIAPSAPGKLTATSTAAGVSLSWGAATDNTGVTGYNVYRWTDAPLGSAYTSPMIEVASVTGTTYTDAGAAPGTQYHYLVRAVDAATNVGPRSNTADVTAKASTTLTVTRSAAVVDWNGKATLTGTLTSAVTFTQGEVVTVQWSLDGKHWTGFTKPYDLESSGYSVRPRQKTCYRLTYAGDDSHLAATSGSLTVMPKVKLGAPVGPSSVKKGVKFTAFGALTPRQPADSKTVRIECYLKTGGQWKLKQTVRATTRNSGSASRYSAKLSLGSKGSWKLVASFAATAKYAATTSGGHGVNVK